MENEDLIEDKSEPLSETVETEARLEAVQPRAKSPWKAFILTGLLASLFGAVGGGAGVYAALKNTVSKPAVQTSVDFAPLEGKIKTLTARLKTAETTLQKTANRPVPEIKPVDMSGIEARLDVLETAPRPDIDPAALSALQAAQKDGFEWPDVTQLENRIAGLESETDTPAKAVIPAALLARLTALETKIETVQNTAPMSGPSEETFSGLEARLKRLENRPAPTAVVKRVSLLAFPKASLIDTVEANKAGGLFEKTLSRHIRVKDANDPLTLIEGIEADLNGGRLAPALEKFERLSDPVRAAGQAWYESVKASL